MGSCIKQAKDDPASSSEVYLFAASRHNERRPHSLGAPWDPCALTLDLVLDVQSFFVEVRGFGSAQHLVGHVAGVEGVDLVGELLEALARVGEYVWCSGVERGSRVSGWV